MTTFKLVRESMPSNAGVFGVLTAGSCRVLTLEDAWLDNKRNISCIPCGTYPLVIAPSARFGRFMPRVLHVPNRDGILIHKGNTVDDVTGCILVGTERDGEHLMASSRAFDLFFASLGAALTRDTIELQISLAEGT